MTPTIPEALRWLREHDESSLQRLWQRADQLRRERVGESVHLRGLLEISNFCDRSCLYCGIRLPNRDVSRYRMSAEEIVSGAHEAVARGYGTIVLQAGEDPGLDINMLGHVIEQVKRETPLAVTLSLGERGQEELAVLRQAGADRYLLRFETSNETLFDEIHPLKAGELRGQRQARLAQLRELGFELGSGVMIGLPGQSLEDLATDIERFQILDLDMIGVGPYVPHPATPLGEHSADQRPVDGTAAQADELTTYKMIALARLACPGANIPSTTALATINPRQGQWLGLQRGANVIMPNLTPLKYRGDYEIYPAKAGAKRTPAESDAAVREHLQALGRPIATGRGDSPNILARRPPVTISDTSREGTD